MSDERVRFSDSDSLISTTTADSHITYCNEDFCRIAGALLLNSEKRHTSP